MAYTGAHFDRANDQILVWERDADRRRILKRSAAPYYFFTPDPNGPHTSLFGDKLVRHDFKTYDEFEQAKKRYRVKFESDIPPLFKHLMDAYGQGVVPHVNLTLFDIETDYDPTRDFAGPQNAYAPINAVTLYHQWEKQYYTLVVPPKGWTGHKEFQDLLESERHKYGIGDILNVMVCQDERELLKAFIELIDDTDILSGWNSEFFDLPYLVKRLEAVLGKHGPSYLCLRGAGVPRERLVERFGNQELTYTLSGRTHLDMLELFKKFTFEGRTSYSLGNILAEEVSIDKLSYDGSLHQLYNGTYVPRAAGTFEEANNIEDKLDRANMQRALVKAELARRKLSK
jgi:DNA polymerase elongation subunit (family B)